jgi:hypothetical protein
MSVLHEPAPEPQTSSAEKRGPIADPQGNRGGRIVHPPRDVLTDSYKLDKDTLTPLPIGVIGLLSLIVGVAILELGNFTAAQFDRAPMVDSRGARASMCCGALVGSSGMAWVSSLEDS